jgi:hypothetical protein
MINNPDSHLSTGQLAAYQTSGNHFVAVNPRESRRVAIRSAMLAHIGIVARVSGHGYITSPVTVIIQLSRPEVLGGGSELFITKKYTSRVF